MGRDDLKGYAWDALLVWGDKSTFKHFLPRLVELFIINCEGRFDNVGPEILFSKFRHGEWQDWPNSERESMRNFMDVLWRFVLNSPQRREDDCGDVETWLCAIAQAENDLTPYLDAWIAEDGLESCLALSGFLLGSAIVTDRNSGRNGFWSGRDQQYQQTKVWIRSPAVSRKLEKAADRWAKTQYEEKLLEAWAIVT